MPGSRSSAIEMAMPYRMPAPSVMLGRQYALAPPMIMGHQRNSMAAPHTLLLEQQQRHRGGEPYLFGQSMLDAAFLMGHDGVADEQLGLAQWSSVLREHREHDKMSF
jgi:hypothetical protein